MIDIQYLSDLGTHAMVLWTITHFMFFYGVV